jgi:hypothetical protein
MNKTGFKYESQLPSREASPDLKTMSKTFYGGGGGNMT